MKLTVLGTYRWPKGGRYASRIGRDLVAITRRLGFKPLQNDRIQRNTGAAWVSIPDHAEVRMTAVPHSQGTEWHQDGDTTIPREEMDFGLIVWASRDPTEVRDREGRVHQPEPFQLILIPNLGCHHRRPPGLEGRRWHFRQRVEL